MQISITEIKSQPQTITITQKDYYDLKRKAEAYEKQISASTQNIAKFNSGMTSEERKEFARKAAYKRWHKEV